MSKTRLSLFLVLLACGIILIRAPSFKDYPTLYLELTKKLILKTETENSIIFVYSERLDLLRDTTIELANADQIKLIAREAIDDFPIFMSRRHGLNMPKPEIKQIVIILASPEYFKATETALNSEVMAYTHNPSISYWGKRIYIKTVYPRIDAILREETIRHEIFHWLAFEYGINQYLPHDQPNGDAYEFCRLRQTAN